MEKLALKRSKKLRKVLAIQPVIDHYRLHRINKQVQYLQLITKKS